MNTQTKNKLGNMFIDSDDGARRCFRLEDMRQGSENYHIYRGISDAMFNSNLSFNFSYVIGEKACDILSEVDWDNQDAIYDAIDQAIPIYTGEIMEIYASDAWIVDEACEDGSTDYEDANTSEKRAQRGWYQAISDMVEAIKNNLKN